VRVGFDESRSPGESHAVDCARTLVVFEFRGDTWKHSWIELTPKTLA
jgi:hypothetical protein